MDPARRAELHELLVEYARTRDPDLRSRLVEGHWPLARHLARRFADRGEPLDDLTQVAALALLKAVERFDPDRGFAFSTFATHTIVGELKRHFRDTGWAVRAPRRLQELHLALGHATAELTHRLGRAPTPAELAAEAGVAEEEVLEALEAGSAYRSASLDAPIGGSEDAGATMGEQLGGEDAGMVDAERRAELEPLLASLPDRERRIVELRFFHDMTQSEIAEVVGISQMHVSRLLARSLAALRTSALAGDAEG